MGSCELTEKFVYTKPTNQLVDKLHDWPSVTIIPLVLTELWQYGCRLTCSCHRLCLLSLHFSFKRLCCSKMLPPLVQKLSTKLLGAQQVPEVSCLFEGYTLFCSTTSFKYFSLCLRGRILSRQQLQTTPCGECRKCNGKWAQLSLKRNCSLNFDLEIYNFG